jgi:hypothetical protein
MSRHSLKKILALSAYVNTKYKYQLTVQFTFIIVTSFSSKRVLVLCGWHKMPVRVLLLIAKKVI